MTTTLTGGCLCGAVRYELRLDDHIPYLCHCLDCQRYTGGPFHAAIAVAAEALTIHGKPQVYVKTGESGGRAGLYFCGTCGGHLFSSPWPEPTRYSVKSGTLDDPSIFAPKVEIWTKRRVKWLSVHGETQCFQAGFDGEVTLGETTPDG